MTIRTRHLLLAGTVITAAVMLMVMERAPDEGGSHPAEPRSAGGKTVATTPNAKATANTPLWDAIDEGSVDRVPDYAAEWSTAGRALVRVSVAMAAADGWRVGDRLTLPLPQLGTVYRPMIEAIEIGPGPSRAALGKVTGGDGQRRRFVVTVGPAHVFAYIDTARGSYELVAGDELGWLLPSSSMRAGFDYSKPDYFLPEGRDAQAIR